MQILYEKHDRNNLSLTVEIDLRYDTFNVTHEICFIITVK